MTSMVERVARAIAKGRGLEDGQWPHFIKPARLAIEAMREPTDAITCAIADASPSYTMKDTRIRIWEAAIDAALNEQVAG